MWTFAAAGVPRAGKGSWRHPPAVVVPRGEPHAQPCFVPPRAGRLNVGLAGSGPGQVSLLDVSGSAQLDGTIEAGVVSGYEPLPGQYEVLSYGSVSGAFSSVIMDLAGSLDVSPVYDADGLDLLVSGVTGVEDPTVPRALTFYGRGASPAEFVIELPHDATLTVRAYDARGREVARLADGSRPAGVHRLALSGAHDLPSGVYFARATIESGSRVETRTARVVSLR